VSPREVVLIPSLKILIGFILLQKTNKIQNTFKMLLKKDNNSKSINYEKSSGSI
jgi:hypothetical protein